MRSAVRFWHSARRVHTLREALERAEETQRLGYNHFITICSEEVRAALGREQDHSPEKSSGLLEGRAVSVKDNYCTKGVLTSCASNMLRNFVPPYNATVVERIIAAGGVVVGKTNLDEFAMGSTTSSGAFGSSINPHGAEHQNGVLTGYSCGGSSGGSAASVASGAAEFGIGSDTGGSVRQPAAWCGVVGFKPTYGRVSRYGLVAYASSLDTPAWHTRNVRDAATMLDVLAGHDERDSTSLPAATEASGYTAALKREHGALRVGIVKQCALDELDDEVKRAWEKARELLGAAGHAVSQVSIPATEYALPAYYIIASAEASSNLARYDGVRYGFSALRSESLSDYANYEQLYTANRSAGFGEEVQRRIRTGTFVLSSEQFDSYYLQATRVRRVIAEQFRSVFENVDVLLTPTTPSTAIELERCKTMSPMNVYMQDFMTIPASLAGLPCASIPFGVARNGMPIGLQLIAKPLDETTLLRACAALEHVAVAVAVAVAV
jgi:aspartyl-tRNA(Asn)/glutamyl-tRNA(Gln) amidotransferase subunit A